MNRQREAFWTAPVLWRFGGEGKAAQDCRSPRPCGGSCGLWNGADKVFDKVLDKVPDKVPDEALAEALRYGIMEFYRLSLSFWIKFGGEWMRDK